MENDFGKIRLYAMRAVFFLTAIALLPSAFQELFLSKETLEPFYGVAISFWLALSVLSILGILYPVRMLPLLILQMFYKLFWLLGIGIPLYSSGNLGSAEELFMANAIGVVLDFLVIPWAYVFKNYLKKPVW